jgi:hypothetical protein
LTKKKKFCNTDTSSIDDHHCRGAFDITTAAAAATTTTATTTTTISDKRQQLGKKFSFGQHHDVSVSEGTATQHRYDFQVTILRNFGNPSISQVIEIGYLCRIKKQSLSL